MPAGGLTVPAVLDQRAEQFGSRVMMSIAGTVVTFAQMRDRSCAAAKVLAELGVGPGETVALFTGTCPEWVYFWLGAARIGAVSAAVNGASKGEFLSHALRLSQAAVVITDAERHPRLLEVSDDVETLRSILVRGDSLSAALAGASTTAPDAAPARPDDIGRCSLHRAPPGRPRRSRPRGPTCSGWRKPLRRRGSSAQVMCCGPPCRCFISVRPPRCWRRCWSAGPACWPTAFTRPACGTRYEPAGPWVSPGRCDGVDVVESAAGSG